MSKLLVLGSNGMLGRAVASLEIANFDIVEISRQRKPAFEFNEHLRIDSQLTGLDEYLQGNDIEYLINCAGLIRQKIDENNPESRMQAIEANSYIPLMLTALSEKYDFKILQIGTDCVYSGLKGGYVETDSHDAFDVYGKSKSIGEIPHRNLAVLRSSIIGLENDSCSSLLSWFLSQPNNSKIKGYLNHIWNGVTVFHFAKLIKGIIESEIVDEFLGVHHVVPANTITKESLLRVFARGFNRNDIKIESFSASEGANMTLGTNDAELNQKLWKSAGYKHPPTIEEMVLEYSLAVQHGG